MKNNDSQASEFLSLRSNSADMI